MGRTGAIVISLAALGPIVCGLVQGTVPIVAVVAIVALTLAWDGFRAYFLRPAALPCPCAADDDNTPRGGSEATVAGVERQPTPIESRRHAH